MTRHTGHCAQTGKRQYKESLDVLLANQHNPRKIRAYLCQWCGRWHATSQPPREG